ncbi:MAG: tRNA-dihydrouridine synthase family protein [Candidatus Micrarchaeota archaeon]|nr:tRNA-dihydrouridine synthase family protein [Candidatus Micrarchaeota archaeon]
MRYGKSLLEGKFVLGPMAAYTDMAFRLLCRKRGAAMCFTEFANANAIVRNVARTMRLLRTCEEEMPVGIQIFGSDENVMAEACRKISRMADEGTCPASCIDINFGCPAGTVVRAGAGSALLRNPEKIRRIVEKCVSSSSLPITAKIRSGWDSDNAVLIAKTIEKAGAAGITVHWRTAKEGRKRADGWQSVAEVKKEVGIPVIGNGGAYAPEIAVRFLQEAKCDAVMISSGALGNPRIFERANMLLMGKKYEPDSWASRLEDFREYVLLAKKHGIMSAKPLRAHAIEFLKGQPGAKAARRMLNGAKAEEEIIGVMESFSPACNHSSSSDMNM